MCCLTQVKVVGKIQSSTFHGRDFCGCQPSILAALARTRPEDHPKYSTTRVRAAHSNQQHTKYYKMDWVWDGMDRSGGVRYRANVPGQVRKALV